MTSIHIVLGLAVSLNLKIKQMDVKTSFLQGNLEEEIFMDELEGFKKKGKRGVCLQIKEILT